MIGLKFDHDFGSLVKEEHYALGYNEVLTRKLVGYYIIDEMSDELKTLWFDHAFV